MHEKIAFIDGRILWLGSLNILSHRDTSECMIRLTGETACHELFDFVSWASGMKNRSRAPCEPENPRCPMCGAGTTLKSGRFGVYFECVTACGGKVDPRRRPSRVPSGRRSERSTKSGGKRAAVRPCPRAGCGGQLVQRNGRFGSFLGCTRYPRCRHTEDARSAAQHADRGRGSTVRNSTGTAGRWDSIRLIPPSRCVGGWPR
jgi:hypothetical protein